MSQIASYVGNLSTYTINVAGLSNGTIAVYASSADLPATLAATTGHTTAAWTGTLAVGNYIVVADAVAGVATGNYYEVFVVVA